MRRHLVNHYAESERPRLSTAGEDAKRAGLRIEEILELDGADTLNLRPASDHLVFRRGPMPDSSPGVTLLIKTCLMEWRAIERPAHHQIRQLEGPVPFVEKVIVADPFGGPFSRQYDCPDSEAHHTAMNSLLNDGVVDRVIYAPSEPEIVRDTYRSVLPISNELQNGRFALPWHRAFDQLIASGHHRSYRGGNPGEAVSEYDCEQVQSRVEVRRDNVTDLSKW